MPRQSTVAKPCTGPDPCQKRIAAAITVVTLASRIELKACWKPDATVSIPLRCRLASSRIRSNTNTFASTPIPIVKINPANPGRVSVKPNCANRPNRIRMLTIRPNTATTPSQR